MAMDCTRKLIAAGILNFISAAFPVVVSVYTLIDQVLGQDLSKYWVRTSLLSAALFPLLSMMPILAGISALRRKYWSVALAGSLVALFIFPFTSSLSNFSTYPTRELPVAIAGTVAMLAGMTAVLFTSLSKEKFEQHRH